MNAVRFSAVARVAVCCFAALVILSGIWHLLAPADGSDDPQPHFTRGQVAFQALVFIGYGLFLLLPPRFFMSRPAFFLGVTLRGAACGLLTFAAAAIIWFQASSIVASALLILLFGAILCFPSALSVWELFHARPNERT